MSKIFSIYYTQLRQSGKKTISIYEYYNMYVVVPPLMDVVDGEQNYNY